MSEAWTIAGLIAATIAAGVLRGYSGFGGGLVMAPFFIRMIGPTESVVLISMIHLLTSFQGVRRSVSLVDFRIVAPLTAAAALSVPIGVVLLDELDPHLIKTAVAVVVIVLALAMTFGVRIPGSPTSFRSVVVGLLSGILNGFCGIGGPPAVLYVLAGNSASAELRASFIVFFAVLYPVTVLTLALAGLISWQAFLLSISLTPIYFIATEIGYALFRNVKSRLFVPVCNLVLCLSAFSMLFA
jgi:uncharacterized protein